MDSIETFPASSALTVSELLSPGSYLRRLPADAYAFGLSPSDTLAAGTLVWYASMISNFYNADHPVPARAKATSAAIRDVPEKQIPGRRFQKLSEHGTGFRIGLTTIGHLLDDPSSLLRRLEQEDPSLPAYVLAPELSSEGEEDALLGRHFAGQAVLFWSFHAEIQGVPEAKVRSAATLAQAIVHYGRMSTTPQDVLAEIRADGIVIATDDSDENG